MSMERRKSSSTKIIETPGFIICGDIESTDEELQKPPPPPPEPPKPVSDEIRAASCRIEYLTHVLEPVIKNGKETGEWRVYIFRRKRRLDDYMLPLKINWDRQFGSKEAADEWVKLALESIGNRKS